MSASIGEEEHTLSGETDLGKLLFELDPILLDGVYVFCTVTDPMSESLPRLKPLASFSEEEGLSLLISQEQAHAEGLDYQGVFKGITLRVHSSLDAVGLTAAVSSFWLIAEYRLTSLLPATMIMFLCHKEKPLKHSSYCRLW